MRGDDGAGGIGDVRIGIEKVRVDRWQQSVPARELAEVLDPFVDEYHLVEEVLVGGQKPGKPLFDDDGVLGRDGQQGVVASRHAPVLLGLQDWQSRSTEADRAGGQAGDVRQAVDCEALFVDLHDEEVQRALPDEHHAPGFVEEERLVRALRDGRGLEVFGEVGNRHGISST